MILETELKLTIDSNNIDIFRKLPFLRQYSLASPEEQELKSIYYDVPSFSILKNGLVLRVRYVDAKYIQTIKDTNEGKAGLHQRHEWNSVVASIEPNIDSIQDMQIKNIFHECTLKEKLQPIFETCFTRLAWNLKYKDTMVECALDQGFIRSKNHEEIISEVELELIQGEQDKLYEIAAYLQKNVAMNLENKSKAERGYALITT